MHLPKFKLPAPAPLVPIVSKWKVPFHRHMRGRRFRNGVDIGPCGPPKPVPDVSAQKALQAAHEAAAKKGSPQEGGAFDLHRFKPRPGHVLVTRGPLIKEEGGIALPEANWYYDKWFYVVRAGARVENCSVGDRVIFAKGHRPKEVWMGQAKFYLGRDAVVIGIVEFSEAL